MPLKEGRCPNCGSLIHLESSSNQGHCLFCDAVFDNAKAFEIAAKPAGVEFPNLPQPKYEGALQTPRQGTAPNFSANLPASRKKQMAKVEPEPFVSKKIKIPEIKVSLRVKLMIGIILVGIAVIFAAVTIPLSIRRDKDRIAILAVLPSVSPIAIESESAAALRRVDNSYLMVATGETVTETQAIALFKAFCEKRAEIRGITKGTYKQVYGGMTLRLAYAGGGFLIDHPDQAALASGEAVETLQ